MFLPTEGAGDAGDGGSQVESFQAVSERVQKHVVWGHTELLLPMLSVQTLPTIYNYVIIFSSYFI
jgi:hypothetical protein